MFPPGLFIAQMHNPPGDTDQGYANKDNPSARPSRVTLPVGYEMIGE
jgi:hypothetical protein